MIRRRCTPLFLFIPLLLAGCGGGGDAADLVDAADPVSSGDDVGEPDREHKQADVEDGSSLRDRMPGGDDYVVTSSLLPFPLILHEAEVQDGLETMEESLFTDDPEANVDARCWMIVRSDQSSAQAFRCGPHVDPDGVVYWTSYPFAAEYDAASDTVTLVHAPQLIDEIRPATNGVDFSRPDGLEAPDEAGSDIANIDELPQAPVAPTDCAASGTVTDSEAGTFDLADADLLEVRTLVADTFDAPDGRTSYRHQHRVVSWDDDADRGVMVTVSMVGPPGDEAVVAVLVDLDMDGRRFMEAEQASGGQDGVRDAEVPADLAASYSAVTGGPIALTFTMEPQYSMDAEREVTLDLLVSCGS
ncbi:MAG: hypothetical protein AB7L17_16610 [Ilumatobacteraceae bacterium]